MAIVLELLLGSILWGCRFGLVSCSEKAVVATQKEVLIILVACVNYYMLIYLIANIFCYVASGVARNKEVDIP